MLGFRVWDSVEKVFYLSRSWAISQSGDLMWGDGICNDKRYIPMQSTGLKDKNGEEIYVGDIIRSEWRPTNYYDDTKVDIFSVDDPWQIHYHWDLKAEELFCQIDCMEIIGNIYENLELLEKVNE